MNLKRYFNTRSKSFFTVGGFILVIFIGALNYWTGPIFSSLVFYFVPIILVTWLVGRRSGILISVACGLTWVLINTIGSPEFPGGVIPFWNLAEKLLIFLIVVLILQKIAQKEEIITAERRQFLSILDTTDDLISIVDPISYEILYANSALRKRFNLDILGEKCFAKLQGFEKPCDFCANQYIFGENKGKSYIWEYQNKKDQH